MAEQILTPEEIEQYRRDGYVVSEALLEPALVSDAHRAIADITEEAVSSGRTEDVLELEPEPLDGVPVARRIYDPFDRHEAFRAIATCPAVLERIASLIGRDIGLHHSKLNMKPSQVGSAVEWHQDLAYFPHTNDDLVTTLVYLDDATVENGCLQVLPGLHDRFFDHLRPDGTFAGMITEELSPERVGSPRALPAPAGSVIFMHCILPHSSLPNRSPQSRRTLIFEYRAADSFPIYYSERTASTEARTHHLCGERAQFARFGGPAPFIPPLSGTRSLYALQEETRSRPDGSPGGSSAG